MPFMTDTTNRAASNLFGSFVREFSDDSPISCAGRWMNSCPMTSSLVDEFEKCTRMGTMPIGRSNTVIVRRPTKHPPPHDDDRKGDRSKDRARDPPHLHANDCPISFRFSVQTSNTRLMRTSRYPPHDPHPFPGLSGASPDDPLVLTFE